MPMDPYKGIDVGGGVKLYGPFYRIGDDLEKIRFSGELGGRGQRIGGDTSPPVVSANAYTGEAGPVVVSREAGEPVLQFYTTAKPSGGGLQPAWPLRRNAGWALMPENGIREGTIVKGGIEYDAAFIDLKLQKISK